MDWLGLVLAVVKLLGVFTQWLHDRQMLDAGKASQVAQELETQSNAIRKALKAREDIRADAERNPSRVPDDDGFRRD